MAKKVHSQKCPACNNMVRYDNPTFPYCRFHAHLAKDDLSMMKRGNQYSFTSNREILYKPEMSKVPQSQMVKQAMTGSAQGTGLESKTIASISQSWNKATKGIDSQNPQECSEKLDSILSTILPLAKDAIEKDKSIKGSHTSIAECKNSSVMMPDGSMRDLEKNHKVIYSSSENSPTIIIDAAPAAALNGLIDKDKKIEDVFPNGHTNFTDRLSITSLYEFADYSGINIDQVTDVDTGEILWDNDTGLGKDSSDVVMQRNMLESSPHVVFPPVVRRRSPTDEDIAHDSKLQEESHDDDLEKLFAEDMGL